MIQPSELTRFASIPNWLCLAFFFSSWSSSAVTSNYACGIGSLLSPSWQPPKFTAQANHHVALAHLPYAILDSEFGDPELGPLCMRHRLRNATFFGLFESLENRVFDASC